MGRPTVQIDGALVVLTGATGGLGGVLARAFDTRGARLLLTGRRIDALEELAGQLRHAEVLPCDMSDRHQVDALLDRVEDADVLVANAALPAAGALDDFTVAELDRALDVNLRTPMLLTQRAAPHMAERGGGHIVLISSMGAKVPASRLSVYAASKYGLRGFGACLRQELAPLRVGVSVIFPGSVDDVGMWAESGAKSKAGTISSAAVARGVLRAIERNRAEVDVAPLAVRAVSVLAHHLPGAYHRLALRAGADEETASLAAGLRHKR